jgi:hypothetical protein
MEEINTITKSYRDAASVTYISESDGGCDEDTACHAGKSEEDYGPSSNEGGIIEELPSEENVRSGRVPPYGGRCAVDYRSTSSSSVFPSEYERGIYQAIHRRNNGRDRPEWWREREWGPKPIGFRNGRDYHYIYWRRAYFKYLIILYDNFIKTLKSYKGFSNTRLSLEDFIDLAYLNSSGFIIKNT